MRLDPYLKHIQKLTQNGQRPKCKTWSLKTPEENIGKTSFDINCNNIFWDLSGNAKETKAKINKGT